MHQLGRKRLFCARFLLGLRTMHAGGRDFCGRWREFGGSGDFRCCVRFQVRDFSDFLKRIKEEFYKNKVLECCGDRKNIICKSHSSILPKRSSELDVATEFGDYFSTKVSKIRLSHDEAAERCDLSGLDATFDGVHGECCRLNRFAPVTREVITSLIKSSPAKTCCLDPLPTFAEEVSECPA